MSVFCADSHCCHQIQSKSDGMRVWSSAKKSDTCLFNEHLEIFFAYVKHMETLFTLQHYIEQKQTVN